MVRRAPAFEPQLGRAGGDRIVTLLERLRARKPKGAASPPDLAATTAEGRVEDSAAPRRAGPSDRTGAERGAESSQTGATGGAPASHDQTETEEESLAVLERAIRRRHGFAFLLAVVNHPGRRDRLCADLRSRLPDDELPTVTVTRLSDATVLDQIAAQLAELDGPTRANPAALLVHGIEELVDLGDDHWTKLAGLNLSRELAAKQLPLPVIVWLPAYALRRISHNAPDLWAWRANVVYFLGTPADAHDTLATLADDLGDDLHEHVARLELLRDISGELVDSGVESEPERAAVGLALGREAMFLDDLRGADASLSGALPVFRQAGARLGEANTLVALGDLAVRNDDLTGARQHYDQALPLYRQIGARLGEANTLVSMAQLALVENDATRARRLFEEAGALYEVVHNTAWARFCREAAAAIVDRPSS